MNSISWSRGCGTFLAPRDRRHTATHRPRLRSAPHHHPWARCPHCPLSHAPRPYLASLLFGVPIWRPYYLASLIGAWRARRLLMVEHGWLADDVYAAFSTIDSDSNGVVDFFEFKQALDHLRLHLDPRTTCIA